jgi:hypothetical protein
MLEDDDATVRAAATSAAGQGAVVVGDEVEALLGVVNGDFDGVEFGVQRRAGVRLAGIFSAYSAKCVCRS